MNKITYTTKIRVRYAETDKMGFVYNGNYFTYSEVGRAEFMRNFGLPYTVCEEHNIQMPLVEAGMKYKHPAFYDDVLAIETSLEPITGATVRFRYNILRDNTTIAEGFTVHSFMDIHTKKPVRPPKFILDVIDKINSLQEKD